MCFSEVEKCPQVVLDMEEAAAQDLFVDNKDNHFNMDKVIFFNSVTACEMFLLESEAVLYVAKWAIGCFRDARIRVLPVLEASEEESELVWIKRRGDPLTPTEMQFLQHLYQYFGASAPTDLED